MLTEQGHPGEIDPKHWINGDISPLVPTRSIRQERSPSPRYESDASRWQFSLTWIDRRNGEAVRITTDAPDGTLHPGVVHVRTYRHVLADYLAHPEAKSLGPDGEPVGRRTVGLLQRRPGESIGAPRYVGKEANRLDDRISGLVTSSDESIERSTRTRRMESGSSS